MRNLLYALLVLMLLLSTSVSAEEINELIRKADEAYKLRYIQEKMEEAISWYEKALPYLESLQLQSQAYVLNRLSQLYYELTTFSEGDTPEDKVLFERGKAYGIRSLELNSEFKALKGVNFKRAVSKVTDPAALLWTANNWGTLLGYDPLAGFLDQPKVRSMYERCLELDESYWGGNCHNALGAMLATIPKFMGGSIEKAKEHFERAIEIEPEYLTNYVVYAEFYGFTRDLFGKINGIRDEALIKRLCTHVLEAPSEVVEKWPFWNRHAKKAASALLKKLEELRK